ncbi:hypothetical protein NPIL_309971, partial [Nephila pilipes]
NIGNKSKHEGGKKIKSILFIRWYIHIV